MFLILETFCTQTTSKANVILYISEMCMLAKLSSGRTESSRKESRRRAEKGFGFMLEQDKRDLDVHFS